MSLEKYPGIVLNFSECDMDGEEKHSYLFRSFRLDIAERRLLHNDLPVPLTPRAFDVLALLVENAGHLVTKDELLDKVWTDSFVEEANVTRIVHTLRRTLGEGDYGNKFIDTVAKKGYRFVAKVRHTTVENETGFLTDGHQTWPENAFSDTAGNDLTSETHIPIANRNRRNRGVLMGIIILSSLMLITSFVLRYSSSPSGSVRTVAVLPVRPLTPENREPIYEFGIADLLINKLGGAKGLIVRPLTVSQKYSGVEQDALAAGREMMVDYVFTANYQVVNGKVRITAQLVNVATGRIEKTYEAKKDAGDILRLQDEFAGETAKLVLGHFGIDRVLLTVGIGTSSDDAYRLYLHGKNLTARQSPEDAQKAVRQFEQAISLDPNFAQAYAGLARAYITSANLGGGSPTEESLKARDALKRAFQIDSVLAEALSVSGQLKLVYDWDFAGAENDLRRAVELEPSNDLAHWMLSEIFADRGNFADANAEIEYALSINPSSLIFQRDRGRILYLARRYDDAIVQLKRVVEIDEYFGTAFMWLRLSYEMKGDDAQAYIWFIKDQERINPERVTEYRSIYETSGWAGVRQRLLEFQKLDRNRPNRIWAAARHAAQMGEKDLAFEYLNEAVEKRQWQVTMLKVEPPLDPLRGDPRYDELVRRVGL